MTPKQRDARDFWLFVGPFLLGLVVFGYVPIGWSLYLSLFDARNTVTPVEFVGLDNYTAMLGNPAFTGSLLTFTAFAAGIVPLTFALSLVLALALERLRFAKAFFRSVFFLPFACSYVVAALIWKTSLFSGVRYGLINSVLGSFGIDPVAWTGTADPPLYWVVLVTARLWLQVGFYMLLFIAALQRIPDRLYEAARLDGAKPGLQVFRYVTWPQLRGTGAAVLLLLLISAFQAFDEFYNVLGDARGYPPYARPPLVHLYYTALGSGGQDLGRGSAGAVILSLLIAIATLAQSRVLRFGGRS